MAKILEARDLRKRHSRGTNVFGREGGAPRGVAVNGVTFSIATGDTFAVVGESGCGKTTLARMLAQIATQVAVMRAVEIVKVGQVDQILHRPAHGYTRELLVGVPEVPTAKVS